MFCRNCGKQLAQQQSFCGECGAPAESIQSGEKTQSIEFAAKGSCENCGAELEEDARFCGECGAAKVFKVEKEQSGRTAYQPQQIEKKKENLLPLIAALIAVVIISAGAVCYFLFWNNASIDAVKDIEIPAAKPKDKPAAGSVAAITPTLPPTPAPTPSAVPANTPPAKSPVPYSAIPDVENKVLDIRAWYNDTVGKLSSLSVSQGGAGKAYYDGGTLVRIDVSGGAGGIDYERNYYFKNGNLYFVFMYRGNQENRFYFYNDTLFRWIDEDKATWDNAFDNKDYISWQESLLNEIRRIEASGDY